MRCARILAPWKDDVDGKPAIYHCLSRVVDRQMLFGEEEKEHFVSLMRAYARFCGVRILTYCIMSNHFHLEVEIPPFIDERVDDEEFLSRLGAIYGPRRVDPERKRLEDARAKKCEGLADSIRRRFTYRMGDLSQFMKSLKQRFTQWYNKRHGRRGTLWEERYKSVLIEGGVVARVVAAYIDLNPVRAGLVKDPKSYRWCGYAAALAGRREALLGVQRLFAEDGKEATGRKRSRSRQNELAAYRVILFQSGEEALAESADGTIRVARKGMAARDVQKVLETGGRLSHGQLVRHRLQTFVDGAVLGSREFVEEVSTHLRPSAKRQRHGHPLSLVKDSVELCSLRG